MEKEYDLTSSAERQDTDEHVLTIDDGDEEPRLLIKVPGEDDTANVQDDEVSSNEDET